MATATVKQTCAKCNKAGGSATCNGCQRSYCIKHFVEHRQELSQQMDEIGQEHDLLRRDLNCESITNSPLLVRINEWEQESIKAIQAIAKKARDDLEQLLDQTKKELEISVDKFTEEIRCCRESDDYTEIDIQKWMKQLGELRQFIENPSVINIGYDNNANSAIRLIKVSSSKRQMLSSNQGRQVHEINSQISNEMTVSNNEKFSDIFGNIILTLNSTVARCSQPLLGGSYVSGIGRYSSKIHRIRFRIEQKNSRFLFFGIITAPQKLTSGISNVNSAYGWWDLGFTIANGKAKDKTQTKYIKSGDEIELILDCDNRQIGLHHHPTNTLVNIPVDLTQCPFPWKVFIRLDSEGDHVIILS